MCYEGQSRNIIKCYCQRVNCSFTIYMVSLVEIWFLLTDIGKSCQGIYDGNID